MLEFENKAQADGFSFIVGVDEAGRGPLAGPVLAAAVILKTLVFESKIADSKKLSPRQRHIAFQEIQNKAYVGVGQVAEDVIDRINILQATFLAMNEAVKNLIATLPHEICQANGFAKKVCLLIDGNRFKNQTGYAYRTIVQGDAQSLSIACASIVAKQTRDAIVSEYDEKYPQYGFKSHKGYPTKQHKEAIKQFGLLSIHRKTFHYN